MQQNDECKTELDLDAEQDAGTDASLDALASPFDGLPLDRKKRMLRLWHFENSPSASIKLHLATFTEAECPLYVALSYAWGDTTLPKQVINVNAGGLRITRNLWEFLVRLHQNEEQAEKWFWADQISMNQHDVLERDHQVGLMGRIYERAIATYSWVGNIYDSPRFYLKPLLDTVDRPMFDLELLLLGGAERLVHHVNFCITLLWVTTQEYWTRLWIIQEVRLASSNVIWCRDLPIEAEIFLRAVSKLRKELKTANWITKPFECDEELKHNIFSRVDLLQWEMDSKISNLLDRRSSASAKQMSLRFTLCTYSSGQCSDPRDKIYGLQALVSPLQRIPIDYSLDMPRLVLLTMKTMLLQNSEMYINIPEWSFIYGMTLNLRDEWMSYEQIAKSLQTAPNVLRTICWSHLTGRLTEDIKKQTMRAWHPVWHNIWKVIHSTACTETQKTLAVDMMALAEEIKPKSQDLRLPWHNLPGKEQQDYSLLVADLAEDIIRKAASRHGFVKYGEYLAHPSEWLNHDDEVTKTFTDI